MMYTASPIDGQTPEHMLQRRGTTLVGNGKPKGVPARERVELLLRAHGPEVARATAQQLGPDDRLALRVIAAGSGSTSDPALRSHAIAALGRFRSMEDLNILFALAQSDPDRLVRCSALLSLAGTGLVLVAPVLRDALASRDPQEREAGEKGLARLARDVGYRSVLDALRPPVGVGRMVRAAESVLMREQRKATMGSEPRRVRSDPM